MTVPLSANSHRLPHARRFGEELDRAMTTRKIGAKRLAKAIGSASSAIGLWRCGQNLPRLDTALRLSDALAWPKLGEIARAGRTYSCDRCGAQYLHESGSNKRFCSPACREIDEQLRRPQAGAELAGNIQAILDARATVKGGIPKSAIEAELARYKAGEAKRIKRVDQQGRALAATRLAVRDFCNGCEPEGYCRTADCALRGVSPLPLFNQQRPDQVDPALGPWAPERRELQIAAIRAGNAVRWARPGERERASVRHRERFASLTDDQRADFGRRVSEGKRRALEEKAS